MPPPTPAERAARDRHFDGLPDPRRNVLDVSELRRIESINERFAPSFRHLEAPAPGPMPGERPASYERRLIQTLSEEAASALARTSRGRALSADEVNLVKNLALVRPRVLDTLGSTAIAGIADTAARVARSLAEDHAVGSFADPSKTRIVEESVNGHTIRSYYGNTVDWLQPFLHPGQTVVGGLFSKFLADPSYGYARAAPPPRYAPPPPSLGPQPDLVAMVTTAVRAALPQRRSRSK